MNSEEENAMEQETGQYHVRRVGSVTFGITLLCYGILFLVHTFIPTLKYRYIFRCWPVVFILLGIMLLFAMIMVILDFDFTYGPFVGW